MIHLAGGGMQSKESCWSNSGQFWRKSNGLEEYQKYGGALYHICHRALSEEHQNVST
jgi:mannose-1-phosphate guanylyltransferase